MDSVEIDTPHGPARAHLDLRARARGILVLGHGAGGGVGAPDLETAARVAAAQELAVVLVEQPYRVAGRRAPAPARQLDAAWLAVIERLRADRLAGGPLIAGGRSSGARVACRTAAQAGAAAVLCLAFPLHPPGKADDPAKSRQGELDAVDVPTLVVQGDRDPFGMPKPGPGRELVVLSGNHGLKSDLAALAAALEGWLGRIIAP